MAILSQQVRSARLVGTSLIGIQTPDAGATIASLKDSLVAFTDGDPNSKTPAPILTWDIVRGVVALNDEGKAVKAAMVKAAQNAGGADGLRDIVTTLELAQSTTADSTVLFLYNAHLFLTDASGRTNPAVVQAVWNLRDTFKLNGRTLVMLSPTLKVPVELDGDVTILDEPYPTAPEIASIIVNCCKGAGVPEPSGVPLERATDAVTGLKAYSVEQVTSQCLRRTGPDVSAMQEHRSVIIENTPGLSVWRGPESFASIGGNENAKAFIRRLIAGRGRFSGVVWIDEIEKQMAGANTGETSGTAQDQQMQLLTAMQDWRVPAILLLGPPGTGKSELGKATGNEAGVPTLRFDLGAMLGGIVGESQMKARAALKMVYAVTAGKPLFIATCNDQTALSPEMKSRFRLGTFFVDLPDDAERPGIWAIQAKRYDLTPEQMAPVTSGQFDDSNWTGREISTACELAWRLDCTVAEAAQYVVPIYQSQHARIERLRNEAEGRLISAAYPGTYRRPAAEADPAVVKYRKIAVE